MQNRVTYEFAIIRYVPKVEREEFVNIGAILFSKYKKFLGIKYTIDADRLKAFCSEADPEELGEYLKAWDVICKGGSIGGAIGEMELSDRFRWLAASKSTVLQCSKTHPGLCLDPEKELVDLFNRYVL
jgi:hypothetical protein